MTMSHKEFVNDRVPPKIWNDSEVMIPFCSPNFISLAWKAKKLGKMGTACSLCAPCALPVRSLCAPCATPVQPSENPTVWTLFDHFVRGLFEIDLGYWSTGYRDTDPQNQKWVWDTDPRLFFGHFAKVAFFFSGPAGRVPIKIFFCRGCQNLSRIKRVDYITSVFTHRSRRFRKLPSKTVPLWPDTL